MVEKAVAALQHQVIWMMIKPKNDKQDPVNDMLFHTKSLLKINSHQQMIRKQRKKVYAYFNMQTII